ncbi:hypothetical protein OS493_036891 [Desmophyllum pertusum]|uniref:Solute carrier family 25 member 51 n=1 Tax=Desmophyllum pertusum TaxID=174260 RepID=A0A9X0CJ41_9CNID|nr:hypothetical protein OS493_036891 [Desmophyllum pertusum]
MALSSTRPAERSSSDSVIKDERDWPDFVCGAGAACMNILATFPAYKVMFRQQVEGLRFRKALSQVLREGVSNLYRGVVPPMMQKGTSLAIMFGSYYKFQKVLSRNFTNTPSVVTNTSAAMLAGSMEGILTPFERVQTLLSHRGHNERFTNTFHAFKVVGMQYGIREYYRGLTPILLRNGPSNVLFFGLRGPIKSALPDAKTNIGNAVNDFASGAVLGACLSTVFFPANVVKSQMQKQLGGEFMSCVKAFTIVFNERGRSIRRLFYGVSLNYTRAMLSWGINNCSYELLKKLTGYGEFL